MGGYNNMCVLTATALALFAIFTFSAALRKKLDPLLLRAYSWAGIVVAELWDCLEPPCAEDTAGKERSPAKKRSSALSVPVPGAAFLLTQ